jgi:hypothetical protein
MNTNFDPYGVYCSAPTSTSRAGRREALNQSSETDAKEPCVQLFSCSEFTRESEFGFLNSSLDRAFLATLNDNEEESKEAIRFLDVDPVNQAFYNNNYRMPNYSQPMLSDEPDDPWSSMVPSDRPRRSLKLMFLKQFGLKIRYFRSYFAIPIIEVSEAREEDLFNIDEEWSIYSDESMVDHDELQLVEFDPEFQDDELDEYFYVDKRDAENLLTVRYHNGWFAQCVIDYALLPLKEVGLNHPHRLNFRHHRSNDTAHLGRWYHKMEPYMERRTQAKFEVVDIHLRGNQATYVMSAPEIDGGYCWLYSLPALMFGYIHRNRAILTHSFMQERKYGPYKDLFVYASELSDWCIFMKPGKLKIVIEHFLKHIISVPVLQYRQTLPWVHDVMKMLKQGPIADISYLKHFGVGLKWDHDHWPGTYILQNSSNYHIYFSMKIDCRETQDIMFKIENPILLCEMFTDVDKSIIRNISSMYKDSEPDEFLISLQHKRVGTTSRYHSWEKYGYKEDGLIFATYKFEPLKQNIIEKDLNIRKWNNVRCGSFPEVSTDTNTIYFYPSDKDYCFAECIAFHLYLYQQTHDLYCSQINEYINLNTNYNPKFKVMEEEGTAFEMQDIVVNSADYHKKNKAWTEMIQELDLYLRKAFGYKQFDLKTVLDVCNDLGIGISIRNDIPTKPTIHLFKVEYTDIDGVVYSSLHCEYRSIFDVQFGYSTAGEAPTFLCGQEAIPEYPGLVSYCMSRRWLTASYDQYTLIEEIYGHLKTVAPDVPLWIGYERKGKVTIKYSEIVVTNGKIPKGIYLLNQENLHWARYAPIIREPEITLPIKDLDKKDKSKEALISGYEEEPTTRSVKEYSVKDPKKKAEVKEVPEAIAYYTRNMNAAYVDAKLQYGADLWDQRVPWMRKTGVFCVIDPPRKHLFAYRLYSGATIQGAAMSGKFELHKDDGTTYTLYYPDIAHDAATYIVKNSTIYTRLRTYHVGSEVLFSVYRAEKCEGGSSHTGAIVPLKSDDMACGLLSLNDEQKSIIHKSLLTHHERVHKIANKDTAAILDARAFVIACSKDKDTINEEDFTIYIVRAARQVLLHLGDVPKPANLQEKSVRRRKKYARKGAYIDNIYRRMLWIKSPHASMLKKYIDGEREYPWYFWFCLILSITFSIHHLVAWWYSTITLLAMCVSFITVIAVYLEDQFPIWVGRIRGWKKLHGCPNCKCKFISCRWCDGTHNFAVSGLPTGQYLPIDLATHLSEQGELHPMTLNARVGPTELDKSYLNNYEKIESIKPLAQLCKELRAEPYKSSPVFFSTLLPEAYKRYTFNSVVPSNYNLLVALLTRQGHYDTQPDEKYLEKIKYGIINPMLYDKAIHMCPIQNQEEFLKDTLPSKRRAYKRSLDMFEVNPVLRNSYRAMCKVGETGPNTMKQRKARLICDPNEAMVGIGAYVGRNEMSAMKYYWKLLPKEDKNFENWPNDRKDCDIFIQGCNSTHVKKNIEKAVNTFRKPWMICLDIKNFDSSEAKILMELIDFSYRRRNKPLYARLRMNKHQIKYFMRFANTSKAFIDFMRANDLPRFKVRRKTDLIRLLRIIAKQSTFSGDPLKTTLGNTNRQLHFIYCLLISSCMLDDVFSIASGDDMFIVVEEDIFEEFKKILDELYAKEGMTGKFGSGLILKELSASQTFGKFLSKNVIIREEHGYRRVYYYRQVQRLLRTGEFSVKPSRKFLREDHFNYMIHEQLKEQVSGDPNLEKVLKWRESRLLMTKPGKQVIKDFYDDYENCYKRLIHKNQLDQSTYYCALFDRDYALLASGATPEEILTS